MCLALFAMRKVFLILRISNINAKLMNLQQQETQLGNYGSQIGIAMNQSESGYSVAQMNRNPAQLQQAAYQKSFLQFKQWDLKRRNDGISVLRTRLETEVKMAMQELENVKKSESQAAKMAAPTYGLA